MTSLPPSDAPQSLDPETVFDILSNRRRRYVLHYLLRQQRPVELSDVTRQVAAWEYGVPVDAVTADQRKRVYNALRQTHLPAMVDAGVVDYDRDRNVVAPTEGVRELEIYLDLVAGDDIPWSTFYLGLAVLTTVVTGLVLSSVPPFSAVPTGLWAASLTAAFLLTSIVHTRTDRRNRLGTDGEPPSANGRRPPRQ